MHLPPPRSRRRPSSVHKKSIAAVVFLALALSPVASARAGLPASPFGPGMDPPPDYVAQSTCSTYVKPGVLAFQRLVMRAYPTTGEGYFTRSCSIGGTSEHKEGRAWDWMVSANSARDRRKVDELLDWLLSRDKFGNRWARARRFGIMYMIWNRKIWAPWHDGRGWDPYYGSSPHTDHVHFSFSWPGARKQTSFWHRRRSFVTAAAGHPTRQGLWSVTGNANVLSTGASDFHGDRSAFIEGGGTTGIAPTRNGEGYWVAKKRGKILAYGDARDRGSYNGPGAVVDIAADPTGSGFWTVTKTGRVKAFGDAPHFGNETSEARIHALASTPTGDGYWLVSARGRVFAFGAAEELGGLTGSSVTAVDIEAAITGGYWITSRQGRVWTFGNAAFAGDARDTEIRSRVVSIVGVPQGTGYWLVLERGRVLAYGTASERTLEHTATPSVPVPANFPADPAPDEDLLVRDFLRSRRLR